MHRPCLHAHPALSELMPDQNLPDSSKCGQGVNWQARRERTDLSFESRSRSGHRTFVSLSWKEEVHSEALGSLLDGLGPYPPLHERSLRPLQKRLPHSLTYEFCQTS